MKKNNNKNKSRNKYKTIEKMDYSKKNVPPPPAAKDVYVLIPAICEWVTLCSKRNFAGEIKIVDLKIGR